MLLYLLTETSLQTLQTNWDYYTPRTDHTYGSSPGPAAKLSWLASLGKIDEADEHFMRAALVDLKDVRASEANSRRFHWWRVAGGSLRLCRCATDPIGPIVETHLPPDWTRLKSGPLA